MLFLCDSYEIKQSTPNECRTNSEQKHSKPHNKNHLFQQQHRSDTDNKNYKLNIKKEAYTITRPRDWKKNPPQGAELEKINRFREACRLTSEQLNNPETRAYWEQRFQNQLHYSELNTPGAPTSGTRKVYTQLWAYTRATILRQLQQQAQ